MKKRLISSILIIALVFSLYCVRKYVLDDYNYNEQNGEISTVVDVEGQLTVHYIDVGQGDSCFIEFPDGETMLIDGGVSKYADVVTGFISSLGYKSIDYLVATHGDSDHIGGLYKVFEEFEVKNCYTSVVPSNTKTYRNFKGAVKNEGIDCQTPFAGDFIIDEENLDVEVVGPFENVSRKDTNDASLVILISFYEYDFLFTGDASYEMLESYNIGDIEVLKASHHGSRTGVSYDLISVLSPEYSVISVGESNSYNHPHNETLDLLENSKIYMTSESGTISIDCDGNSLSFTTEK